MSGRPWTRPELDLLRDNYREVAVEDLADTLRRSARAVWQRARIEGVAKQCPRFSEADKDWIRKLVAKGWCNRCIGRRVKHDRQNVRRWRRHLGLPAITVRGMTNCPVCKERTRATTKEQCKRAGVKSLAEVRGLAFAKFARNNGWPENLRPREVQILNVLAARGVPMTRLEIAQGIGMRTDREDRPGHLAVLTGNGPGGTYTASLMQQGLLLKLKRAASGFGQGKNRDLYYLGPAALAILEARICPSVMASV
jgi:hypothetical protein